MQESKISVLIISAEPWGSIWYSKQHYANELSKLGYDVFFLDPPNRWKISSLISTKIEIRKTPENIKVLTYSNNFPLRILKKLFHNLNDYLNAYKLVRLLPSQNIIFWQFDPTRLAFLPPRHKRIYHVADPYIHLPLDKAIASRANLIVCTSPKYVPFYTNKGKPVIQIPHGISAEESQVEKNLIQDLQKKWGKYILLVGTLNDTIDYSLIDSILSEGFKLIVAGIDKIKAPSAKNTWAKALESPNIEFLGQVHAKKIKELVAGSRVCITAYKFDLKKSVGQGTPLKVLNYLAQFRPIITTIDSEIPRLEGKAIYRAYDLPNFMELLQKGLNGELEVDRNQVATYLSQHQYPNLIDKILTTLEVTIP